MQLATFCVTCKGAKKPLILNLSMETLNVAVLHHLGNSINELCGYDFNPLLNSDDFWFTSAALQLLKDCGNIASCEQKHTSLTETLSGTLIGYIQ